MKWVAIALMLSLSGCAHADASTSEAGFQTECVEGQEVIYIDPAGTAFEFELTGRAC